MFLSIFLDFIREHENLKIFCVFVEGLTNMPLLLELSGFKTWIDLFKPMHKISNKRAVADGIGEGGGKWGEVVEDEEREKCTDYCFFYL